MKKILLVLALAVLVTAGCTANNKTNQVNENNAPGSVASDDQNIDLTTDDYAASVIEPTGEEGEGIPTTPPIPTQPTADQNSNANDVNINSDTKNMNMATVKTSVGTFVIELDTENAPISAENFKKYAQTGYFNGTLFHRVMPGFMVQGGGFDGDKQQKDTDAPIKNEATNGLKNDRGTVAMARTNVVDSATSQFFVNLVNNDFLNYQSEANYGYAVFGKVVSGMDVVDAIAKVQTGNNGGHQNWPIEDVIIESVTLGE